MIEGAPGSLVRLEQFHGERVDQKNIQIAVVVIIKERDPAAHRLGYIFLFRGRNMFEVNTGWDRDIDELNRIRLAMDYLAGHCHQQSD